MANYRDYILDTESSSIVTKDTQLTFFDKCVKGWDDLKFGVKHAGDRRRATKVLADHFNRNIYAQQVAAKAAAQVRREETNEASRLDQLLQQATAE